MKKFRFAVLFAVLCLLTVLSGTASAQTPPCPTGKICSGSVTFTVTFPNPTSPSSVSPAQVVAGAAATTITLSAASGSTFNNQMVVEACQVTPTVCTTQTDLATTFVSASSMTAVLPSTMLTNSGTISIYISQPNNAHAVNLQWQPSTSTVAGYNMYRSTTSGSGYTKINTSLIASTTFIDSNVQNTTTYFYVATAVDSSGNESSFSNQATAVIP